MSHYKTIDYSTPWTMAKGLAGYISNASTVQVRVNGHFGEGRAPEMSQIAEWIEARQKKPETKAEAPRASDAIDWRPQGIGVSKVVGRAPAKPFAVSRRPKAMWPIWYKPPLFPVRRGDELLKAIAAEFGLTLGEIKGPSRKRDQIHARAVFVRIQRAKGLSYPQIGSLLGGRDHSTAINLDRKFEIYAERDARVAAAYNRASIR